MKHVIFWFFITWFFIIIMWYHVLILKFVSTVCIFARNIYYYCPTIIFKHCCVIFGLVYFFFCWNIFKNYLLYSSLTATHFVDKNLNAISITCYISWFLSFYDVVPNLSLVQQVVNFQHFHARFSNLKNSIKSPKNSYWLLYFMLCNSFFIFT